MFFNHGCNPNTAFIGLANGQLAFRTIREVKKDEELVVSYIDLYSDRDERRQDLLTSKHFWCKCKRCTGPLDKSVDRFLQGVVCSKCGNDVYVIPATMMDDLTKGHRALYTESKSFKCAACNYERGVEDIQAILEEANKSYQFGMAAIRQERNYRRASEKLELITKSATTKNGLHTLNSFRLNAYIPLMNCMRYNNNLKGAIETNKAILSLMSEYSKLGLPGNTAEISDYWQNLGELCDKMSSESRGRGSILEKKWSKESRHAFGEALKIRIVVFGKDHPKTKHVEKLA
jgi:SET and MYND domain-containing protein